MNLFLNQNIATKIFLISFIQFSVSLYSQEGLAFKERFKTTLKGDITLIANSVLNRIDRKNSPNDPFHIQQYDTPVNDEFDMEYIDIDNDKSTFSSSSAALFMKNETDKKIVFAGLYWSATYKYESGYKKGQDKFVAFDKTREPFHEILLKLPNTKDYTPILGQVLFDGAKNSKFKDAAPYLAFADVTRLVQELENPFGFYTVANVKATQGTLIGGSAAGWTIVFVYEDQSMTEKYISVQDGFLGAMNQSMDIAFQSFETPPYGDINAKLVLSALEGDFNVDGDLIMFNSTTSPDFTNLKTGNRPYSNFFNSKITHEDAIFKYRIPDSENTLGYDALVMTLPNNNNRLIGNRAKEARVKMKSTGDVFYLFLCGLALDVKEAFVPQVVENTENRLVFENDTLKQVKKEDFVVKPIERKEVKPLYEHYVNSAKPELPKLKAEKNNSIQEDSVAENKTMISENKVEVKLENEKSEQIKRLMNIDAPKGFYLVANVFSDRVNAARFMMQLRDNGLNPNYFTHPETQFLYVYLAYYNQEQEAQSLKESKFNQKYTDELWVLAVNIPE